MTEAGITPSVGARHTAAAAALGILVAGVVAGAFLVNEQAGRTTRISPSAAAVSVQPPSPDPGKADTSIPLPARSAAAELTEHSDAYYDCVEYAGADPVAARHCADAEAAYRLARLDPARSGDLPINQPPAGCYRYVTDEPGIFSCTEEVPKARDLARCRSERSALGLDPDLCGGHTNRDHN